MKFPPRSALLLSLAIPALGACGVGSSDRTNPCDPSAPPGTIGQGILTGTVSLEQRADPLGAQVVLRGTSFQASVAADGSFTLKADPGTYAAVAVAPGYVTQSFGVVTVERCRSLVIGEATLRLALGQVQGQLSLEPVVPGQQTNPAGTLVSLTGTPLYRQPSGVAAAPPGLAPKTVTGFSAPVTFTVVADASGGFLLIGIPLGTYQLDATAYGYDDAGAQTIVVGEGTSQVPAALSLLLHSGVIGGSVQVPAGAAPGGVQIDLSGVTFNGLPYTDARLTASNGAYTFNPVPAGNYTLSVDQPGYEPQPFSTLALAPGQVTTLAPPVLVASVGSLQATVVLGAPINQAGITVTLSGTSRIGAPVSLSTATDAGGNVSFPSVLVGTYTATAQRAGCATVSTGNAVIEAGRPTALSLIYDTVPPTLAKITTPSAVTNATTYVVMTQAAADTNLSGYQKLGGGYGVWTDAATSEAAALSFSFALNRNQNNTLQVRAVDCAGNAGPADFVNVTEDDAAPDAPGSVQVVNRNARVDVRWSPSVSSDVQGYLLYYGSLSSATNPAIYNGAFAAQGASPIDVGNTTSFTLTGLQNLTPFYVALRAYDRVPNLSPLSASAPAEPAEVPLNLVQTLPVGPGEKFHSVALVTDYALVTIQGPATGTSGLRIYDIGVPTEPSVVGFYNSATAALFGLAVSYPYAVVTEVNPSNLNADLRVIDFHNPTAPTSPAGAAAFLYTEPSSFLATSNVLGSTETSPVTLQWPFAFVPGYSRAGMVVVDLSNPALPKKVASFNPQGFSPLATEIQVNGRYAYVNYAANCPAGSGSSGVFVVDISNPGAPADAGASSYLLGGGGGNNLALAWPYLYAGDNCAGFGVYNIANPTAPVSVNPQISVGGGYTDRVLSLGPLLAITGLNQIALVDVSDPTAPRMVNRIARGSSRMASRGTLLAAVNGSVGLDLYEFEPAPPIPAALGSTALFGGTFDYSSSLTNRGRFGVIQGPGFGVRFVDWSSSPSSPTVARTYGTTYWPIDVYAAPDTTFAYVSGRNGTQPWLMTIDISNLTNASAAEGNASMNACSETAACDCGGFGLDVQGGFAYVATGFNGLGVFDVRAPLAPRPLATLYDPYDCTVGTSAYGGKLFVADRSFVYEVDIRDPTNPNIINHVSSPGAGRVLATGRRVYVTGNSLLKNQSGSSVGAGSTVFRIFDADTLSLLGSLDLGPYGSTGVEEASVSWPYAYVGDAGAKVWILDVSNAAQPVVVTRFDTLGGIATSLEGPYVLTGAGTVGYTIFGDLQLE